MLKKFLVCLINFFINFFINEDRTPKYRVFWLIAVIIISVWIGQFLLIKHYWIPNGTDPQQEPAIWAHRGVVGDSFGAINALFSGLALAGVLFTIFLQRAESKGQTEDFNKQLDEIKKQTAAFSSQVEQSKLQTQAIINQLDHYEKQTSAILEQLVESKEQTKAINEEAKESAKQTKELTRQIKLSIMPSFVVEIFLGKIADVEAWRFKMTNIGNGSATNVNFETIEYIHKNQTIYIAKTIVGIDSVSFIRARNDSATVLNHRADTFDQKGVASESATSYKTFTKLVNECQTDNFLRLKINFEDIEGTKYEQEIKIGKIVSIPGEVKKLQER